MDGLTYLADLDQSLERKARGHQLRWVSTSLKREPHGNLREADVLRGALTLGAVGIDIRVEVCTDGCHAAWFLSHKGTGMGDSIVVPTTEDIAPHVIQSAQHAMGHLGVRGLRGACTCGRRHARHVT